MIRIKKITALFLCVTFVFPSQVVFAEDVAPENEASSIAQEKRFLEEGLVKVEGPVADQWKNLPGFQDLFGYDKFTGAVTVNISVDIPRSENSADFSPDLSLTYNSYSKNRLSPYGYGWDINASSISRLTKFGIDKIYNTFLKIMLGAWWIPTGQHTHLAVHPHRGRPIHRTRPKYFNGCWTARLIFTEMRYVVST